MTDLREKVEKALPCETPSSLCDATTGLCPACEARPAVLALVREQVEKAEDAIEWNTILQIFCRVHPDGADCMDAFREWPDREKGFFNNARAAGAWLYGEMKKAQNKAVAEARRQAISETIQIAEQTTLCVAVTNNAKIEVARAEEAKAGIVSRLHEFRDTQALLAAEKKGGKR